MNNNFKNDIRKKTILLRKNISKEDRERKSRKICLKLFNLKHFIESRNIFIYCSTSHEVSTEQMIKKALQIDKEVVCPVVYKKQGIMKAVKINSFEDLAPGAYGIMEPADKTRVMKEEDIDLSVVPGVAFDEKGVRVGYGGGYYDRFLPQLRESTPIIALSFECQVMMEIPSKQHDVLVDIIITEDRIIYV